MATAKTAAVEVEKLQRRHVVCLPYPAQSHIGAMLKLAKLLHRRGFHVSFINTEFNYRRMLKAQGSGFADDLPRGFRFLAIPDGLPPSQDSQSVDDMCYAARQGMSGPFCDLIGDLNRRASQGSSDDEDHFPTVSCIVSDGFMTFSANPAAKKYELPIIHFWTVSACALMGFKHYGALMQRGFFPLKDDVLLTNGHLDTIIDWIPGLTNNIRLGDLPNFSRTTDPNDVIFNFAKDTTERANEATATIIHTFEPLEQDVLNAFSSILSGLVYPIGPLHVLLDKIPEHEKYLKDTNCSLWKEDIECLQWLDTQKANSVLYINFGSVSHLTHQQLVEFAMGISNSKQPFLWIVRPDLVMGDDAKIMPVEFVEETRGRGLLSSWCPQEKVLNHPSIGGFLTHCGWNSIMESLSAGIPMLCWPYFADQQTNCRYTCVEWQAGLEIHSPVMRGEVESLMRELMIGEKRNQLKMSAMKWKKLASEAADPQGSSSINIDKLLDEILFK